MTLPRVKPLGWGLYEIATSGQLTLLDINASKGVDGTYVKDYAAGLWFPTLLDVTTVWTKNTSQIYIPKANAWLGIVGGGSAGCQRIIGNGPPIASTTYPTGQGSSLLTSANAASDGNDTVLQGSAVASGATCFRRTTISGDFDVWTTQSSSAAQTGGGGSQNVGLVWHAASSLFIASYSITTNTSIDTSPDGITFTSRTLPNTDIRGSVASSGITAVCLSGSSTNQCLSSPDGITWTARTLPFFTTWVDVCWSTKLGLFFAATANGHLASSPDGATWTDCAPLFAPGYSVVNQFIGIRDLAGMLIATFINVTVTGTRKGVMCSIDAGASWRPLVVGGSSNPFGLATSGGQCVWVNGLFAYFSTCLAI